MPGIILPSPWTKQPQFPTRIRRELLPVAGFNAGAGFVDTEGATFTVGSGITPTVNKYGREADFNGSTSALTRGVNVSSTYPKTFVAVCRHDTAGVRMLGSLATSGDKTLRVYMDTGVAYAQHIGATTSASASVNFISYGFVGTVVAVYRSQNDVTLYASGNTARAKSQSTTDVGTVGAPTLLAFGAYNGSAVNQYLDGGLGMAAWLGVALSEQEAWSVLDNPWQIFQPIRKKLYFGAAGSSSSITQADGTSTAGTLTGSSSAATTPTTAAGTSTAASLTGSATAAAAATGAAGVSTASTVAATAIGAGSITQADGVTTAATLAGAGLVAGASSITAADGTSTAATLAGSSSAMSTPVAASCTSTASSVAGSSVAACVAIACAGASAAMTLTGSAVQAGAFTGPSRARIGAATLRKDINTITLRANHARIGSLTP